MRLAIAVAVVVSACAEPSPEPPVGSPNPSAAVAPRPAAPVAAAAPLDAGAPAPPAMRALVPVALDTLEEWPALAGKATEPVELHAVDAPLDWLVLLIGEGSVVMEASDVRVTGTSHAPSLEAAHRSLALEVGGALPDPAPRFTGKSRKVDLAFAAVEVVSVSRLLCEVLGLNLVLPPQVTGRVTIMVKNVPAMPVLDAVLGAAGLVARLDRNTVFVTPAGASARVEPTLPDRPILDVQLRGATAGQALAAIDDVVALDASAPCDPGPTLELRLRSVGPRVAARAIAHAAGVTLGAGRPACPGVAGDVDEKRDALIATVVGGGRGVAVWRGPDGVHRMAEKQSDLSYLAVVPGRARIRASIADLRWELWPAPPASQESSAPQPNGLSAELIAELGAGRARLAATIVTPRRKAALVERADGGLGLLRGVAGFGDELTIAPGRVVIQPAGGATPLEIGLARRAQ